MFIIFLIAIKYQNILYKVIYFKLHLIIEWICEEDFVFYKVNDLTFSE